MEFAAESDHRARLVRFYQKYQPEKLDEVDKLLAKAAGKEEQLFRMLVKKYGPEPSEEEAEEMEAGEEEEGEEEEEEEEESPNYRERLERFYRRYQPDKLGDVDKLLLKAAGKEEQLFRMLTKKYGPEPDEDDDEEDEEEEEEVVDEELERLERFYKAYAPEKLEDADFLENLLLKQRSKANGNVEPLFSLLVKKYGPEPPTEEEVAAAEARAAAAAVTAEAAAESAAAAEENSRFRRVQYCPVDGLPAEYCEYGPCFENCLEWLESNCPSLVLTKYGGQTVADFLVERRAEAAEKGVEGISLDGGGKKSRRGPKVPKDKKKKKKGEARLTIERVVRSKRKCITIVIGLDTFPDIKLKEAAKKLGKRFACGSAINKLPAGGQSVDIQGDVFYEIAEYIVDQYPQVEKDKVFHIEQGKSTKAFQ